MDSAQHVYRTRYLSVYRTTNLPVSRTTYLLVYRTTYLPIYRTKYTLKIHPPQFRVSRLYEVLYSCYQRNSLAKIGVGFRVGELMELFDLQAPVFVGDDVDDDDRLAIRSAKPRWSLYLGG